MAVCNDNKSKYTRTDYYNLFADDTQYKPALIENTSNHKHYESKVFKEKNLSVKQCLLMIVPHISAFINGHKDETEEWKIQLTMRINFVNPRIAPLSLFSYANSDNEEIKSGAETNEIVYKLCASFLEDCYRKEKAFMEESNLRFTVLLQSFIILTKSEED